MTYLTRAEIDALWTEDHLMINLCVCTPTSASPTGAISVEYENEGRR